MVSNPKTVAIIGAGPAGLMAAEVLSPHAHVDIYDAMPTAGRKILIAGKGGLNITHSEPLPDFLSRYGSRHPQIESWLRDFSPAELQTWVHGLGIETFVGTSGRVFPAGMKAAPLLRAWLHRLRASGVAFHMRHKWTGWNTDGALCFTTPDGQTQVQADATLLALGGGSWPGLGSTGEWVPFVSGLGTEVAPLRPANCGFNVAWTEHFRTRFDGHPVKSVALSFKDFHHQGEFIITAYGLEGSLIYAASAFLRDEIEAKGSATLSLDLCPHLSLEQVTAQLGKPRGSRSMSNHLEKTLGLKGVKAGLMWEFIPREDFSYLAKLAAAVKALKIPLLSPRPIAEAISSAGGITFHSLDEHLMLRAAPGIFCAGEMLDWEAPTGGYLLTACLASGRIAAHGAIQWLTH